MWCHYDVIYVKMVKTGEKMAKFVIVKQKKISLGSKSKKKKKKKKKKHLYFFLVQR